MKPRPRPCGSAYAPPRRRAQRRDLGLQLVLLDDPVGPYARHQRIFADHRSARLDQRHRTLKIKGTPAELDRLAVSKQLAAMRQHPETTQRHARRGFGGWLHWRKTKGLSQRVSGFFRPRAVGGTLAEARS
jgi:hypothetical protein